MGDDVDDSDQRWWVRMFREREEEFTRLFGLSHPPGSPEDYVISLDLMWSEDHPTVKLPGACVQVFPPEPLPTHPDRLRRSQWLYLTHGLSQPLGPGELWRGVGKSRQDDRGLSGYGAEFGVLLDEPAEWGASFLAEFMTYVVEAAPVRAGHRVGFGFDVPEGGELTWFMGLAGDLGVRPLDETAAMLFWSLLGPVGQIITSTGTIDLLVGTSITQREWELAKATTSAHLLLLLCRAGVGQRTVFGRGSVVDDSRWAREWEGIERQSYDAVCEELAQVDTVGGAGARGSR